MQSQSPLTPSDGFSRAAIGDHDAVTTSGVMQRPTPTPPPGLATRWLDRALRIANGGPRLFYLAAILSLAVTSALAMTTAALIRPHGQFPVAQRNMMAGALVTLCLSAVLGLASLAAGRSRPAAWLDRLLAPRERAAIWLALAAWFPFLLLVVYYRAKATFPPPSQYIYFPYDDKRWETAAYLLGVIAPAIWLTTAARVLAVGRCHPRTWRAWCTGLFPRIAVADPGLRPDAVRVR